MSTGARSFFAQYSLAFPNFTGAAITVNIGWLGLQHLLTHGGTGYFPARLIREHEISGRLHRVVEAPEFRLPAYLCFAAKADADALSLALDTIRRVASEAG